MSSRWRRLGLVPVATVVALVVTATPSAAIPTDPPPSIPCTDTSTGQVSSTQSSLTLGQPTTVTWSFTPGSGCTAASVEVLFLDQTSQVAIVTGLTGASGTSSYTPQSTGALFVQAVFPGAFRNYGSAPVTVVLPVVNGKPTVGITRADQRGLFAQAIGTEDAVVWVGGLVDLDLSYMHDLRVAPGVQIMGDRSLNPRGPRLFTTTFPPRLFWIGTGDGPSDNVHISGLRFDGEEPDDPCDSAGSNDSTVFTVISSQHVEIDHNEFYGWRGSDVDIHDPGFAPDHTGRINRDNAGTMWVHDNFMHDNKHPTYCGPNPATCSSSPGWTARSCG